MAEDPTSCQKPALPEVRLVSEEGEHIIVKCPKCEKASKLKRSAISPNNTGYTLNGEGKCSCGLVFHAVYKDEQIRPSSDEASAEKRKSHKQYGCLGSIVIILFGVIAFNIMRDRVTNAPTKSSTTTTLSPSASLTPSHNPKTAAHGKIDKDLPRKLAVATYYEQMLRKEYGMMTVRVQGTEDETLQISMIRITDERIKEILIAGVYKEAKRANFKNIRFIDINQEETIINLK